MFRKCRMQLPILAIISSMSLLSCSRKQAFREDEEALARFVREKQPAINQCFSEAGILPGRRYEVRVEAEHLPDGSFSQIRFLTGHEPAADCVIRKLESWKSSPPLMPEKVQVSWAFTLKDEAHVQPQKLDRFQKDFDRCFEEAKQRDPNLVGGLLRVQLKLDEKGKIESFQELSGFRGSDLILSCLRQRSRAWEFSEKEYPSTQVWTWNFKTKF